MKKKIMALLLCGLMAVTMAAGCGSSKQDDPAKGKNAEDILQKEVVIEMPEGVTLETNPLYEGMTDQEFVFSSGVGAWQTILYVKADGSFEGLYQDDDAGDSGEGYPGGTRYRCSFTGAFAAPEQIDQYTYKTQIISLVYRNPSGATEIVNDNIRMVYGVAYGLDEAKDIYIYLPGKPESELSESFLAWTGSMVYDSQLSTFGIFNENTGAGFVAGKSSDYEEEYVEEEPAPEETEVAVTEEPQSNDSYGIEQEIEAIREQNELLLNRVYDESLPATKRRTYSYDLYMLWDNELNDMWARIKTRLDESSMARLKEEQIQWIKDKEAAVEAAGSNYDDLDPEYDIAQNMEAYEWTIDRVYYLMDYLR